MDILRSIWHIRAATTCKKSEYNPNGLLSVMYAKTKAEITLNYKLQIKRSPCECILEGDLFSIPACQLFFRRILQSNSQYGIIFL